MDVIGKMIRKLLSEANRRSTYGAAQSSNAGSATAQGGSRSGINRGIPGYPVPPEMKNAIPPKQTDPGNHEDNMLTTENEMMSKCPLQDDPTKDPEKPFEDWYDPDPKYRKGREVTEADTKDLPKGIAHLEDLRPDEFLRFLEKYKDLPLNGGLEVSEKVDGSARISFGADTKGVWTQSKNGPKRYSPNEYSDKPMFASLKAGASALQSKAPKIKAAWPKGIDFFVAELLYTKIPNSIEYGPNVIMIHGVHPANGKVMPEEQSRKVAEDFTKKVGSLEHDGPWKFEYKRIVNPKDVMVDTKEEYTSIKQIYDVLKKLEPNRLKAVGKAPYKAALEKFKTIQLALKKKLVTQLRKQKSSYGPEGGDVEGLVFRDLESGDLIKLVDKEYFTKLNKFLWHYRELLDKGVKVGDKWEFGIMQKFRNVIADEVLGAPVAKTPGFVRMLQKRGEGLKYPEKVDTAEKRADYLLAKYIDGEGLMSGDFVGKFQKSLESVYGEFTKLRKDWDSKKKSEISFTAKDDEGNPIKKVKMDDIIKQRTDQSFSGMEEFFRGIHEAMGKVGKMRGDLTKKVALLKLMLGQNRFEKLAAGSEEPGEKEESATNEIQAPPTDLGSDSSNDIYAYPHSMRESDPGTTKQSANMGRNTPFKDVVEVLKKNAKALAKRGIVVNPAAKLGSGSFGYAFEIVYNGKRSVLKVTGDPSEAKSSNHIKGKPLKHVVRIYDAFQFKGEPTLYGIVEEKLDKISETDMDDFDDFVEFLEAIKAGHEIVTGDFDGIERKVGSAFKKPESLDRFEELAKKFQFKQIIQELHRNQVEFLDFHRENIMRRGTDYVVIDLGISQSPGKAPDVLETMVRTISRLITEARADKVAVTIGRFQPFHRGHAEIIRTLARQNSKVIVIVAGNTVDKKNPFPYDLRLKLMEKSLADVWSKIEVYPAKFGGKNSGYIPGVLSDIIKNTKSSLSADTAFTVMVGADRFPEMQKQIEHSRKYIEQGGKLDFDPDMVVVKQMPGVKNDDDTDRISGTRVRQAIEADDKDTVRKMMDPHLVSNPTDFDVLYKEMRAALGTKKEDVIHEKMSTVGGEDALMAVIDSNKDLLLKHKPYSIDSKRLQRLGAGEDGIAFDMGGDHVFKITTDQGEARSSMAVKGKQLNHVVKVFDVFQFGAGQNDKTTKGEFFGIVLEHLQKLTPQEAGDFDQATRWIRDKNVMASLPTADWNSICNKIKETIQRHLAAQYGIPGGELSNTSGQQFANTVPGKLGGQSDADTNPLQTAPANRTGAGGGQKQRKKEAYEADVAKTYTETVNSLVRFQVPLVLRDLKTCNVKFYDFHSGNMMKRGTNYVITDLGRSESGGARPPVLEKIVEQIINEIGVTADMTGQGQHAAGMRAGSSGWSSAHSMYDEDDVRKIRSGEERPDIWTNYLLPMNPGHPDTINPEEDDNFEDLKKEEEDAMNLDEMIARYITEGVFEGEQNEKLAAPPTTKKPRPKKQFVGQWTPWTEASKDVDFNFKPHGLAGRGEAKVAAELGLKDSGVSGYDLVGQNGNYEVKEIKEDGSIRLGREGKIAARPVMKSLEAVCDQLREFNEMLGPMAKDIFKDQLGLPYETVSKLLDEKQTAAIFGAGELPKGLMQIFRTILHKVSEKIKSIPKTGKKTHTVGGHTKDVDIDVWLRAHKMMGFDEKELETGAFELAAAHLHSKLFVNPDLFDKMLEELKPSTIFKDADFLIFVNSSDGYFLIPRDEADKYVKFERISGGTIKLGLGKVQNKT